MPQLMLLQSAMPTPIPMPWYHNSRLFLYFKGRIQTGSILVFPSVNLFLLWHRLSSVSVLGDNIDTFSRRLMPLSLAVVQVGDCF